MKFKEFKEKAKEKYEKHKGVIWTCLIGSLGFLVLDKKITDSEIRSLERDANLQRSDIFILKRQNNILDRQIYLSERDITLANKIKECKATLKESRK